MGRTKKTKEITANAIELALKIEKNDTAAISIGEGDNKIDITVKTFLPISERSNMINDIVSMVFATSEDGEEVYAPYFRSFAINFNIVNYFTNITLPTKSADISDFFNKTDIVEAIISVMKPRYFRDIMRDVNELISYKKEKLMKRTKFDDILTNVSEVITEIKKKTDGMDASEFMKIAQEHSPELMERVMSMFNKETGEMAIQANV